MPVSTAERILRPPLPVKDPTSGNSLVKIGIDPPLIATEFFSLYITPIKCVDHHIKNALEYTKGKCRKLKGLCDIYEVFMKPYKLCCLHHINAS